MPHSLTDFITDNLPQAQHGDRLTLRTAHVDSTRPIPNPAISPKNSRISVAERSRIDKPDPSDLDASKQSNKILGFGISFLDEPRIGKRSPHNANDPTHLTAAPKAGLSSSDEPHVMKRSPNEGDDDQENGQEDPNDTPPSKYDDNNLPFSRLLVFGDAPRHHRRGL